MTTCHRVKLLPSGKEVEVEEGKNLLESLRSAGVYIKSSCGGHATCSDCIVVVKKGDDSLLAPEFAETRLLGNVFHITKERLACQTKICGDVEIDISAHDPSVDEQRALEKNTKAKNTFLRKKADQASRLKDKEANREQVEKKPDRPGGNRRPKPFKFPKD